MPVYVGRGRSLIDSGLGAQQVAALSAPFGDQHLTLIYTNAFTAELVPSFPISVLFHAGPL